MPIAKKNTGYTDKRGKEIHIGDTVMYKWWGPRSKQYKFIVQEIDGAICAVPAEDTNEIWRFTIDNDDMKYMTVIAAE